MARALSHTASGVDAGTGPPTLVLARDTGGPLAWPPQTPRPPVPDSRAAVRPPLAVVSVGGVDGPLINADVGPPTGAPLSASPPLPSRHTPLLEMALRVTPLPSPRLPVAAQKDLKAGEVAGTFLEVATRLHRGGPRLPRRDTSASPHPLPTPPPEAGLAGRDVGVIE